MLNIFKILILFLGLSYLIVLVGLYAFQRSLLYEPSENNYLDGETLFTDIKEVHISTSDNYSLKSWYHFKNQNYKTLLFLHGNAGVLENRIYKLNKLKDLNVNFLIFSWRGFSGNSGSPNERGLYDDANSAVKWLNKKGVGDQEIVLYGESLGSAVAVEISQHKNFAGIILESPFTSMIDVGRHYYPYVPVRLILKDKFETKKKIKNINFPLLVMHGKLDKIVPFTMGKIIFDLANQPKFYFFPNYDDHMMNYDQNLLNAVNKFLNSLN